MQNGHKLIPMNLQFFNDETATGNTEAATTETKTATQEAQPYKVFTDKKHFDAVELAAKAKGQTAILTELGLKDISELATVKIQLEAARKAAEANQTEAQRREAAYKKAESQRLETESKIATMQAEIIKRDQMDLIRDSVTDKVAAYGIHAIVSTMDGDFAENLKAFLADGANSKYTAATQATQNGFRSINVSTGGQQQEEPKKFNMNSYIRNGG